MYFYNICKFSSKKGTRKTIATRGYHSIGHQLVFQLKLKEMYERWASYFFGTHGIIAQTLRSENIGSDHHLKKPLIVW